MAPSCGEIVGSRYCDQSHCNVRSPVERAEMVPTETLNYKGFAIEVSGRDSLKPEVQPADMVRLRRLQPVRRRRLYGLHP